MRDVVPPGDRSIRNIPVPAHRKRLSHEEIEDPRNQDHFSNRTHYDEESDAPIRPRKKNVLIWIAASAIIGILVAVLLSYFFSGATVTVTPKKETAQVNIQIPAKKDAPLGILPYDTLTQSVSASRTVPTTGEAQVNKRASGSITLSNTFSTAVQRLIKNTRFEAANGKIYRTDSSVDVPGGKKLTDGTFSPGTVEVQIFADSPGADYNQGPTTFTIPGFKGDPRYTKFNGKSTTPIKGGFVGTEKVVSDADLNAARDSIASELSTKLVETLKQNVPEGYVYVERSERISTEDQPRTSAPSGGAVVTIQGTASAAIIKSDYLASALLKSSSKDYKGEAVKFVDASKVSIAAITPLDTSLRSDLSISLRQPVDIVWQFDQEALKTALIGIPASNLNTIMQQFKPAIEQANVSLRPVWTNSFPKQGSEITIKIKK